MPKQEVYVEFIDYKLDAIAHAGTRLIYNFAKYSGIEGTHKWIHVLDEMAQHIKEGSANECIVKAPGIDIRFSGFKPPSIPFPDNDRVIFGSHGPRFYIEETPADLLPSQKTHIQRVSDAIKREMVDVYGLKRGQSPEILNFPKTRYAKNMQLLNAVLVS